MGVLGTYLNTWSDDLKVHRGDKIPKFKKTLKNCTCNATRNLTTTQKHWNRVGEAQDRLWVHGVALYYREQLITKVAAEKGIKRAPIAALRQANSTHHGKLQRCSILCTAAPQYTSRSTWDTTLTTCGLCNAAAIYLKVASPQYTSCSTQDTFFVPRLLRQLQ